MAQIILINEDAHNRRVARIPIAFIAFVALFLLAAGAGGTWLAVNYSAMEHARRTAGDADAALVRVRAELERYRELLAGQAHAVVRAREYNNVHLDTLGRQVGALQAETTRLDALGQRLIDAAGLDDGEFDFSRPPPQGGLAPSGIGPDAPPIDLNRVLDQLSAKLDRDKQQLNVLERIIANRKLKRITYPSGWPTLGGWISSPYGYRRDPINGQREFHSGIDIANRYGAPVRAVAAGVVTRAESAGGYGLLVEITHGNGYTTRYAHNSAMLVKVGDKVKKDQVIARVGSSGRTTGPHLHFEVFKDDHTVDPRQYLKASG